MPEDACEDGDEDCSADADSPFRRIDGRCNNVGESRTRWGATSIAMRRYVAPRYQDAVDEPFGGANDGGRRTNEANSNALNNPCGDPLPRDLPSPRFGSSVQGAFATG